ncbi:MAG TPA: tetrahydrofolate dehydrogenase/cyclohydrolase catalytic domain-containing protein [Nitrospirota bacterium]|jgi:methylenetetrahydrofolate dehydrogenase (NADP+)/methenyltetrahydrofolate cyclohydrolase|nr:tetrahydrofolate dehydrogenase/cyclohydrolase catalytic domain-containing protein [Nitrospirota bacterium]
MPAKLLTGKEVAQKMDQDIQKEVQELKAKGVNPALKIMIVGDAADSLAYANSAKKMAEKNGIACDIEQLPGTTSQDGFVGVLKQRNADRNIHGIIVMRPFPKQIREDVVKYILSPEKDVDCFNPVNAGKIMAGDMTGFPPATPQAVMEILRFYQVPMSGREAVVIGRSMVVGKPLSMLLLGENATVTVCHSKTQDLPGVCRRADILVAAIGKAKMITPDFIKPGATVMDVGINVEGDKLFGDVDTEPAKDVAGAITPVPGGVGTVTTRVLLKHVVKAARLQNP